MNIRALLLPALLAAGCLALVLPTPEGIAPAAWRAAVIGVVMALLWMTEALPLAATALIPIAAFPLGGVASIDDVARAYANPLIFLFLGGFMLAAAMKRWHLHNRLAVLALRLAGPRLDLQVLAVMVATAFLSLWISNTATAMVMMPIGLSMLAAVEGRNDKTDTVGSPEWSNFGPAIMLGIAFSATIGGIGSLIGTPPNALFAAYVEKTYGVSIGFGQWMMLGLPVVLVLLPLTWLLLTRIVLALPSGARAPDREREEPLPPLTRDQRIVAAVLVTTAFAWILRPLAESWLGITGSSDAGIAIAGALALFVLPAKQSGSGALLAWDDVKALRWDVLILFGGGLALADAIHVSGLADTIGAAASRLGHLPLIVLVLVMMVVIVFLGELASNTAMAALFLPIAGAAAVGLGVPPLSLVLPVALAASLGFMLPVATPPNAIVYGSGAVTSQQMMRAGALLDLISIAIVFVIAVTLGPLVLKI